MNGSGNGVSFTWTPSQPLNNYNTEDPVARIKEDTRFVLMVEDDLGCRSFDTMWLRIIYAENVYVPSAFSPNGDGLNDIFSPAPLGGIRELEYFRVYNRLGELVFDTRDITEGWDGTYRGRKQDVANYVWVLKGKNKYGVMKFLKGNVVLIR
jgi:gliding motility-associated-like protein